MTLYLYRLFFWLGVCSLMWSKFGWWAGLLAYGAFLALELIFGQILMLSLVNYPRIFSATRWIAPPVTGMVLLSIVHAIHPL